MDTFGERLRAERERLGLSQIAFGELGGVQKVAQINYEKDKRKPDAEYLAAIAAAGVDVLYVLTGQRSQIMTDQSYGATSHHMTETANPVTTGPPLNRREQALLANYRGSDEQGRRAVESTASALAHRDSAKQKRESGK